MTATHSVYEQGFRDGRGAVLQSLVIHFTPLGIKCNAEARSGSSFVADLADEVRLRLMDAPRPETGEVVAWRDLFFAVAKELGCLAAPFVDDNAHVLRKAAQLAHPAPPSVAATPPAASGPVVRAEDIAWLENEARRTVRELRDAAVREQAHRAPTPQGGQDVEEAVVVRARRIIARYEAATDTNELDEAESDALSLCREVAALDQMEAE